MVTRPARPPHPAPYTKVTVHWLFMPRIGVHLSTAGGVFRAAERAHEIRANTFQIFSSSPRMWRQPKIAASHCARMRELRESFDVSPLVIHASYLINVAA